MKLPVALMPERLFSIGAKMLNEVRSQLLEELSEIDKAGTHKSEAKITSMQGAHLTIDGKPFINFCANNYLGLSNHSEIISAV